MLLIKKLSPEDQKHYNFYFYNGLNYFVKEDYALAIKEWKKALEIKPNDTKISDWIKTAKRILTEKQEKLILQHN